MNNVDEVDEAEAMRRILDQIALAQAFKEKRKTYSRLEELITEANNSGLEVSDAE